MSHNTHFCLKEYHIENWPSRQSRRSHRHRGRGNPCRSKSRWGGCFMASRCFGCSYDVRCPSKHREKYFISTVSSCCDKKNAFFIWLLSYLNAYWSPLSLFPGIRWLCLTVFENKCFLKRRLTWPANIDFNSMNYISLLYGYNSTPLWLAAKRALVSCNDGALLQLPRCSRHIQSVFNLIVDILMDIHVMVNWQLSKRASADQCHLTVSQLKRTTHWSDVFF